MTASYRAHRLHLAALHMCFSSQHGAVEYQLLVSSPPVGSRLPVRGVLCGC